MRRLGSVWYALFVLATLAAWVAVGTVIEARTESHDAAARWTYRHPLFLSLLALLAINLTCAALNRLPWQKRHLPFLLAHLGLLMVIGGTVANMTFGLQGKWSFWKARAAMR